MKIGDKINVFTIKDLKIKRDTKRTRTFCLVECPICHKDKWMRYDTLKTANNCGCVRIHRNAEKMNQAFSDNFLKEGTNLAMLKNKKPLSTNTTGVRGVTYDRNRKTYNAVLNFQGKTVLSKRCKTLEEAVSLRKEAEEKYFKPILDKYHNHT